MKSKLQQEFFAEIRTLRSLQPAIIAIDGPAGAGKSTIGYDLAAILDFLFFDTGIMYRAVTWAALDQQIVLDDGVTIGKLTEELTIDITPVADEESALLATGTYCHVQINQQDITAHLRTPEIDRNVSVVSAHAQVREALSAQQRRIGLHYGGRTAEKQGIVMAGRDIGTVILPDAPLKIYMVASAAERARRRFCEERKKGKAVALSQILREIERRDQIDSQRALSPLRRAQDALEIDTSELAADEVLETILLLAADQVLIS